MELYGHYSSILKAMELIKIAPFLLLLNYGARTLAPHNSLSYGALAPLFTQALLRYGFLLGWIMNE